MKRFAPESINESCVPVIAMENDCVIGNCPVPCCTLAGIGMRLSWGWDWAETKAARRNTVARMRGVRIVVGKNVSGSITEENAMALPVVILNGGEAGVRDLTSAEGLVMQIGNLHRACGVGNPEALAVLMCIARFIGGPPPTSR